MEVIKAKYYNSGGNVLVYYGQLENGRYFSLSMNQLFILDADYAETLTEEFYNETEGDTYEWDKKHTLESYSFPSTDKDAIDTVKNIFKKLKEIYPNGDWDRLCKGELLMGDDE